MESLYSNTHHNLSKIHVNTLDYGEAAYLDTYSLCVIIEHTLFLVQYILVIPLLSTYGLVRVSDTGYLWFRV